MTAKILSRITRPSLAAVLAGSMLLASCDKGESGPILVSVIGGPPALRDPNRAAVDPPSAFLAEAIAQGLVRFDASGQIKPALAQRWIVSDDGLRYTFRLARVEWADGGGKVTARQVVARLNAAMARTSHNRLKPLLGAIEEVSAMTDDVLEITLKGPRPNFLQLLAQPELAIVRNGSGSGPYASSPNKNGALLLTLPKQSDADDSPPKPHLELRGERAALAVIRFAAGGAHLVTGGTAGDLLIVQSASLPVEALRFDPVSGLFGLAFVRNEGALTDPTVRHALSMAIDRTALVADMRVPGLAPRATLLPPGTSEVPQPAAPVWAGLALEQRRQQAARTIEAVTGDAPLRVRVAVPPGPGYRVVFAHLRGDWHRIGVEAQAVGPRGPADLRLVDEVAPVTTASWFLHTFTCAAGPICSAEADQAMETARVAQTRQERRVGLIHADALLRDLAPFIPLTAPVRWSLVSPRLTGFQPSIFARHAADELIAPTQ